MQTRLGIMCTLTIALLMAGCSSSEAPPQPVEPPGVFPTAPTSAFPTVYEFEGYLNAAGTETPAGVPGAVGNCFFVSIQNRPIEQTFSVPKNASAMEFNLTWDRPGYDLFLGLRDPTGVTQTVHNPSPDLTTDQLQHIIDLPAAGEWLVQVCPNGPAAQVTMTLAIEITGT